MDGSPATAQAVAPGFGAVEKMLAANATQRHRQLNTEISFFFLSHSLLFSLSFPISFFLPPSLSLKRFFSRMQASSFKQNSPFCSVKLHLVPQAHSHMSSRKSSYSLKAIRVQHFKGCDVVISTLQCHVHVSSRQLGLSCCVYKQLVSWLMGSPSFWAMGVHGVLPLPRSQALTQSCPPTPTGHSYCKTR